MAELLTIDSLRAGYGDATVLAGISLTLPEGASLAVLGRNGMGKTTLLASIIGLTRRFGGDLRLGGADITHLKPEQRAAAGIGWVPQERNIFRSLTVEENLTAVARPGRWDVPAVFALFPNLHERRRNMGDQLSGGEQQMLAIARALMLNPRLLLLDEPTEGLAPIIVEQLLPVLRRLVRGEGISALIVEQHAQKVLGMTDQAIILERGSIAYAGRSAELQTDEALLERYLGVTGS